MTLVHASSTPRTTRSFSVSESSIVFRNCRTNSRTSERFAGWLANSISLFIPGRVRSLEPEDEQRQVIVRIALLAMIDFTPIQRINHVARARKFPAEQSRDSFTVQQHIVGIERFNQAIRIKDEPFLRRQHQLVEVPGQLREKAQRWRAGNLDLL